MRYDRSTNTLVCSSIGGPTTTVLWMKNGISLVGNYHRQSQRVVDTVLARYENNLTLTPSKENISGLYSCVTSNRRGISSAGLWVSGKGLLSTNTWV